MPLDTSFQQFSERLSLLERLSKKLPKSIAFARKSDAINTVFENIPVPQNPADHFEAFNRRMDILFGDDVRDANTGRLYNLKRGPFGIDLVIKYIKSATDTGFLLWTPAQIKVDRLIAEIEEICAAEPEATQPASIQIDISDDDDDDYQPPRRESRDSDSASVTHIIDSEDEEIVEETELGETIRKKRAAKKARIEADPSVESKSKKGKASKVAKAKVQKKKRVKKTTKEIDSGEESDGQSALKAVEDDEDSRAASRRGPPNQSLQFFFDPTQVVHENGKKLWEFKCRHCGSRQRVERTVSGKDCTFDDEPKLPRLSNLSGHATSCKKKNVSGEGSDAPKDKDVELLNLKRSAELMASYLRDGELNPEIIADQKGFYRMFAAWILDESLPWTTGEAPALRLLFKYIKVNFTLPTDTTVRNYLGRIFAELHAKVVREFTNVKSKIAYSTDTWTTRSMVYTFACTIGSFIDDDWKLIERVVDFAPLGEHDHEGVNGGLAFVNGARERGGLDKISTLLTSQLTKTYRNYLYFISLTTDNASVNDVIVKTAARCLLTRYGIPTTEDMHIRCFAHVINLVVQAFLAGMDEGEDPDDFDWYEAHKEFPIHYSPETDQDQLDMEHDVVEEARIWAKKDSGAKLTAEEKRFLEDLEERMKADNVHADSEFEDEECESVSKQSPIKKLRYICTKIVSSPQRRMKFYKISFKKYKNDSKTAHLAGLMVVRDVRTRWNYTHAMICRALLMREAIDDWVYESSTFRGASLTKADWTLLETVANFLEPFTKATERMSVSSEPTISYVLPIFENLQTHLVNATKMSRVTTPIRFRQGAQSGLDKLLKYKSQAQSNQYYTIGTVLHPYQQSQWFRTTASTENEKNNAVEKAEALFKHVANTYFVNATAAPPPSAAAATPSPEVESEEGGNSWLANAIKFDVPESPECTTDPRENFEDEVRRYLRFEGGRGKPGANPLIWWKTNGGSFPTIAKMARDFLAIPATSVSVERCFSKSRHICSDLRSSLKADTIKKALLSKVWIKAGLFDVNPPVVKKRKHGEIL